MPGVSVKLVRSFLKMYYLGYVVIGSLGELGKIRELAQNLLGFKFAFEFGAAVFHKV